MNILWQHDQYVMVVDEVELPDEDGEGANEIRQLFQQKAWIIVWRSTTGDRWNISRNRHFLKPSLRGLKAIIRRERIHCPDFFIGPEDRSGHMPRESNPGHEDVVQLGQALYAAWEIMAARELPAKMAFIAKRYGDGRVQAWMVPGQERYAATKAAVAEIYGES